MRRDTLISTGVKASVFPQESETWPVGVLGIWPWDPGNHITGLQAACLLPGSVVADPVFLECLLEAFHLRGLGVLETSSGRYRPSPRAMPDGVERAGNTKPVSHIPTLIS